MPRRRTLAQQMVARLAVMGAALVVLATGVVTSLDYYLVRHRALDRFDQIETSHLPSIIENAWLQDQDRLSVLALGILSLPYTVLAEVSDQDGRQLAKAGRTYEGEILTRTYPLTRFYQGQVRPIGQFTVGLSLTEMHRPVIERAWIVFLASAFIVTALLAGIFELGAPLVTRPLARLAAHARALGEAGLEEGSDVKPPFHGGAVEDEFSDLAKAFADMRAAIRNSYLALQESETRHRSLFSGSPVSLWEEDFSAVKSRLNTLRGEIGADLGAYLDAHPEFTAACAKMVRVTDVNPATLALHRATHRDELLGPLDTTFTPSSYTAFRRQLLAIWHGETEVAMDGEVRALDGETRDVVVHWGVAPGHLERLDRVIVALEDVTERRAAERSLSQTVAKIAQVNVELERFAYAAAHDLQEPVRGIVSFSQLLQRHLQGRIDLETGEFLQFLVNAAQRMQTQVQGLQAYASVAASGGSFTQLDMSAALGRALDDMNAAIAKSGARIEIRPMPKVWGDAGQLAELWQRLLSNSVKFARPSAAPVIRISATPRDDDILFTIEDEGIGIAPEYAANIFQVFHRLHGPDSYPGAGIGLAICRRIVERHGGQIWVDTACQTGARICFTLPHH